VALPNLEFKFGSATLIW